LQRAVRDAVVKAGISKPASCHTFLIRSQPTCLKMVTISARFRNYSATVTSVPRWSIHMCWIEAGEELIARRIDYKWFLSYSGNWDLSGSRIDARGWCQPHMIFRDDRGTTARLKARDDVGRADRPPRSSGCDAQRDSMLPRYPASDDVVPCL